MTDLDKLIEAVEAGTACMPLATACYPRDEKGRMLINANAWHDTDVMLSYDGSLDAAKALHDALLPGWVVKQIGQARIDGSGGWSVWLVAGDYLRSFAQAEAKASTPARAWLIAILKAYRSQVQK